MRRDPRPSLRPLARPAAPLLLAGPVPVLVPPMRPDPEWEARRANLRNRDQAVFDHAVLSSDNCPHDARCKCFDRAKAEAFRVLDRMVQNGWTLTPPPKRDRS